MKILIRKSDDTVMYADDNLVLTDSMAHGLDWRDRHFNLSNAIIADADLPSVFGGSVFTYANNIWTVVNTAQHEKLEAEANPIPQTVSMRQARLALLQEGYYSTVNSIIAAMTGPEGEAAQIAWNYASFISRTDPLVVELGAALTLNDTQLDNLFILANTL